MGLPLESRNTLFPGRRTNSPSGPPEPTVLITEGLGWSTALATVAESGGPPLVFPVPPTWLMSTMMISTITTTPTLADVRNVGDCQVGRRESETERTAAWLRRCFLVSGLPVGLPGGGWRLPGGFRWVVWATVPG